MNATDNQTLEESAPDSHNVRACRTWNKYAKTAALVYSWISLGLYSEILGPTLPTLMHQTGSNYQQVGLALSVRSVGLLSGSLAGGFVSDKWTRLRAVMMSASLVVAAMTNFIIPRTRNLEGLATILYVAGCSHGFLTTHGNPLLGAVWGSKAAGPFSLMHAGYGLGAALAPILVAPFSLAPSSDTDVNATQTYNTTGQMHSPVPAGETHVLGLLHNSTESALIDPTVPYNLVGIIALLSACCFLPFGRLSCVNGCGCRQQGTSKTVSEKTEISQSLVPWKRRVSNLFRSAFQRATRQQLLMILCTFIIYFAVVGNERVFGKFMFTYAIYGPVQMSTRTGYILHLVYWFGFGMARLLTFGLAFFIPAQVMLGILAMGTLIVSASLIVIPTSPSWFFVFTCLFSLFKSPLFPGTLAAINLSHEITGFIVLIVNVGSACGASMLQYIAGSLIQLYGQTVFPYLVCGSACVVLLTATALIFLLRFMGTRFDAVSGKPEGKQLDHLTSSDEGLNVRFIGEDTVKRDKQLDRV